MPIDPIKLLSTLLTLIDRAQPAWKKEQQSLRHRFNTEVRRALEEHHVYVSRWSQEAHSVSFGTLAAGAPTIDLRFETVPRRVGIGGQELDELDVLLAPSHIAVLGDPGAGKTTTLRRLAHHVAHEPEISSDDGWRYVVLIVCRDERWDTVDLYSVLGRKLGVTGSLFAALDNPESRIRQVLNIGAVILIDGLDEVPQRFRADLERSITQLGRHLRGAKIVVSCRSADYVSPLGGFEIAEIRPLTANQIRRVVFDLLEVHEANAFYSAMQDSGHPAADLTNRPLFLTQMIAIFRSRGTIPDRPVDLYESITRHVIQEWDEQRGVRRVSTYGEFGVDDKRRFLADLAYELIGRDLLRFDEVELVEIYRSLAERYSLPKHEARQVARELESHTGLLIESGEHYEFSHLSLQEFLAADSMVRRPASARTDWRLSYPAVAAVATAMSSDANGWFAELIGQLPRDLDDVRPIRSFLHRLGQERPRFIRSSQLGHQLLSLLFRARVDVDVIERLGEMKAVRGSVADALADYDTMRVGPETTRIARYKPGAQVADDALSVSTAVLAAIVGRERLDQVARAVTARS